MSIEDLRAAWLQQQDRFRLVAREITLEYTSHFVLVELVLTLNRLIGGEGGGLRTVGLRLWGTAFFPRPGLCHMVTGRAKVFARCRF